MQQPDLATRKLIIMGAGGFAREVAWLVSEINQVETNSWNLLGFWDRDDAGSEQAINGIPVLGTKEVKQYIPNSYVVAAIGDPNTRMRAIRQAQSLGCRFATLVHPATRYDQRTVSIGCGTVICAGNILTVDIRIGAHVLLNLDCTVGHDSILEDFATVSPGCHLSGRTIVRERAYLGTGSVTIENIEIGARSTIGAGAVVVRSIPSDVIATGVPARVKGA